jgi:endonuclease YncB( thermonuclease family)
LLKKGLVKLDTSVPLPESHLSWEDEEAYANEKKIGLWGYDEEEED